MQADRSRCHLISQDWRVRDSLNVWLVLYVPSESCQSPVLAGFQIENIVGAVGKVGRFEGCGSNLRPQSQNPLLPQPVSFKIKIKKTKPAIR